MVGEVIHVQGHAHEVLVGGDVHVHVPEQDHHRHEDVEIVVAVVRTLDHVLVVEDMVVLVEEVIQDLVRLVVDRLILDEVKTIKILTF